MVVGGVECNEIVRWRGLLVQGAAQPTRCWQTAHCVALLCCGKPNARHCTESPNELELLYCLYCHYCHYYHYQHSITLLHAANSNT